MRSAKYVRASRARIAKDADRENRDQQDEHSRREHQHAKENTRLGFCDGLVFNSSSRSRPKVPDSLACGRTCEPESAGLFRPLCHLPYL